MNYAELAFRLKPRGAWEAADLGVRIARHWWLSLMLLWLAVALPTLLLLVWLVDSFHYALLVFWWLKPLYERPLLYFLSRAVFGNVPSLMATLKQTPKLIWPQLLMTLTVRRFSPGRSFDTPVLVLEGLKGKARSNRISVLHRDRAGSVSFWLTLMGAHVEFFIWVGVVATILAFVPEGVQLRWEHLLDEDYIQGLCAVLSMALVAPFYVAGGFGLYLNRRIVLEGWDLELVFRDMRQRKPEADAARKKPARHTASTTASCFVLVGLLFTGCHLLNVGIIPSAMAADEQAEEQLSSSLVVEPVELTPGAAREALEDILQSSDFHLTETRRIPEFIKNWLDAEDKESTEFIRDDWLLDLGEQLAKVFQLFTWLGVIALILFVLYYYRDGLLALAGSKSTTSQKTNKQPGEVLNLDIRESSLPDDVAVVATTLWNKGHCRDALALLYRASLSRLVYRHHMRVAKGATEGDCLRLVNNINKPQTIRYFQQLTLCWQTMAYAHLPPDRAEFEQLCQQWPVIFENSRDAEVVQS